MSDFKEFDKFMDAILIKEGKLQNKDEKEKILKEGNETPQRAYIRKYHEKPLNRIVITRRRG